MSRSRKGTDLKRRTREWLLKQLRSDLKLAVHHLPPFGAALGQLTGSQAADVVVAHRVLSKLEFPEQGNASARRAQSIADMISSDVPYELPAFTEETRMARARLGVWTAGFKPRYRFVPPSGASARANAGEEDIMVKLSDLDNWEVSTQAFPYAFNIVWHNQALKRLVKKKWNSLYPYDHMNAALRSKHGLNGYQILREKFKMLVSFNECIRVTTVPKNNNVDRVIGCVPLWDMISQLSFMRDIRDHFREKIGYDVNTRADLHNTLLPHSVATVDLSAASDRVSVALIKAVWPPHMWKWLHMLRNTVMEYDVGQGTQYHHIEMFAPMGCGTTFDVMTFTLLALLRFDKSASVFGDDIIVKQASADKALRVLRDHGLVVNTGKSFISGKFRESCGGMWHDEIGYIESYDITYPEDLCDWMTTTNKLGRLLHADQVSFEVYGALLRAYQGLVGTFPRVVFADLPIEVRDDCITGFQVRHSNAVTNHLEVLWHRPCWYFKQHRKRSVITQEKVCPDVQAAILLFRGVVDLPCRETRITHSFVEGEGLVALRHIPLQPTPLM